VNGLIDGLIRVMDPPDSIVAPINIGNPVVATLWWRDPFVRRDGDAVVTRTQPTEIAWPDMLEFQNDRHGIACRVAGDPIKKRTKTGLIPTKIVAAL
jgi:hypothetical protein